LSHRPSVWNDRLLRPPMARLTMLILLVSKYLSIWLPHPSWPLAVFLTVESPTRNSVGR
jgi:hypothetical protein